MEMDRAAVRAIDDPAATPEAHKAIGARRTDGDEAVRGFIADLARRCQQAGIKVVPGKGGTAP
jgi:hypothetical protein